jgi:hypothetical protein
MPENRPAFFISYRGGDAEWGPDLVYTTLVSAFGEKAVFKAGFSLRAGDDFPLILAQRAAFCPVMLVCMGPRWLTARNPDGTRRLDDTHDWVRREIELSLRNGNHVIPLLLGNLSDTPLPRPQDLPAQIAPLVHRQAFRLEPGGRLQITLPALVERMNELIPHRADPTPSGNSGTITGRIKVRTLRGKVVGVRAHEGVPHQIDADIEVEDLAETGEATIVDLLQRDRGLGR